MLMVPNLRLVEPNNIYRKVPDTKTECRDAYPRIPDPGRGREADRRRQAGAPPPPMPLSGSGTWFYFAEILILTAVRV